ncbi:flagellar basal body L-ring protein FlgH [Microbulbifer sp. SAOS-129_SWC]|uniref:flagellar basal body L-ring protein FlgH n=1 Tax=Microbulbifer sp. SAOS-129_SWC TaxID=3145235 RepID=UPI0032179839
MVLKKFLRGMFSLVLISAAGQSLANGAEGYERGEPEQQEEPSTGSLYHEESYRALVEDNRAYSVGDTITVMIYEAASATSKADTDANKNSDISLSATDSHNRVGAKFSGSSEFNGGGVERRSGEVLARISATVEAILPNGELFLRGDQVIALNNESQVIYVEGRVRKEDISTDNIVLSTRLADSTIRFQGEGLLSKKESPGLISRALEWLF